MRRQRQLPLEALAPYCLETVAGVLDWAAVFGNDHPVEIEVGFGKGLFLLTAAAARPDRNFLGIEIARKYQLYTAGRLAGRGLGNVRLACADALAFLRDHVADASVEAIHVYFPDPWWKRRHRKRRLFSEAFAGQVERVLRPGGRLHLVTDVAEYFAAITDLLGRHAGLAAQPTEAPPEPRHDLDYLTHFERKYRQQGRPIHRAAYRKLP